LPLPAFAAILVLAPVFLPGLLPFPALSIPPFVTRAVPPLLLPISLSTLVSLYILCRLRTSKEDGRIRRKSGSSSFCLSIFATLATALGTAFCVPCLFGCFPFSFSALLFLLFLQPLLLFFLFLFLYLSFFLRLLLVFHRAPLFFLVVCTVLNDVGYSYLNLVLVIVASAN